MAADARGTVERAITRAVRRHALWSPGARLVAAVSGGADSLCLLGALLALRERGHRLAPGEIIVAHFDHGLRAEESREDARFVEQLATGLGLPCAVGHPDAPYTTELHISVEDWARRARYAFLRRVAAEHEAEHIVTGHTRDDQAETILLHWLRGSGLAGLRGMAPLRGDIARPLLDVTRAQTVAYCAALGWQPREDSSNADPRFMRNRIRRELLPLLETYNPGIRELLVRNGELLADDEAYMTKQAQEAWDAVAETPYRGGVRLHRKLTPELPPALRHRLFRAAVNKVSNGEVTLEARHITGLDKQLLDGHTGSFRRLPGGISAIIKYDALVFQKDATSTSAPVGSRESAQADFVAAGPSGAVSTARAPQIWTLIVPGVVEMAELGWRIRAWRIAGAPGSEDASELPPAPDLPSLSFADRPAEVGRAESRVYLDASTIGETLTVRTWQPGDRFRPLGMHGEKKLQDYFGDAKVPRELRGRLPLVFNADHLVWVAGLRIDDRVRLTPATQAVVALQLESLTAPLPDGSNR
ncbi:MAG TPA: tRNA lysidine(34) synthetase TilS [Ktedonobacterales bacterium]|nr:tRNA lysidine(34) synthetase TilS [Ktedonobacterales bacterium]